MSNLIDVQKGVELKSAYDQYILWQNKTRAQKQLAYKGVAKLEADRVKITNKVPGYIVPFSAKAGTVIYYETMSLDTAPAGVGANTANTVQNLLGTRVKKTVVGPTDSSVNVPKFKFARIIASERITTATDTSKSRFTDIPYKRHRSNNVSAAFGRLTAGAVESFEAAVATIKNQTDYKTFNDKIGNRVGFVAEGA